MVLLRMFLAHRPMVSPAGRLRWLAGEMVAFDDGRTLADRFRAHAQSCTSPLYAELLGHLAQDWEGGGAVRQVCAGCVGVQRGQRRAGGVQRASQAWPSCSSFCR